jgi:2-polyprenyl-6-methoxyphenol hydroxylase-like FAD-dependent oxidoreductase
LPAGPFAILPLTGKRSSLVWTENRKEAARITGLSEDEFHEELESGLACISARSRRSIDRARFRSAISSRALSLPSGWRWSATPRM